MPELEFTDVVLITWVRVPVVLVDELVDLFEPISKDVSVRDWLRLAYRSEESVFVIGDQLGEQFGCEFAHIPASLRFRWM